MTAKTQEIEKLQRAYRRAIDTARDERMPVETRERAARDQVDLRHQIDNALVEAVEEQEEQRERDEAREVRARFGAKLDAMAVGGSAIGSGVDRDTARAMVAPIDPNGSHQRRALSIPLTGIETRTEYPILTSDSSHTYGSYATPTTLARETIIALVSESAVMDAQPRILRTTSGELVNVPVVLSGGLPTADYRSEGAAALQDTPVFSKTELAAYHLAGYIEVSNEFLTDALSGDAEAIIGRMIGAGLGAKLATELALGDGSSHVNGAFYNPTTGKSAAAQTSFTSDELTELRGSVSSANRKAARWLMSDAAFTYALLLKDDNGQPLLQPAANAGVFDTLWGQPVHVDAYGPALTSGKHPVLYGRFDQAYAVRFAGPLEISYSDDVSYVSWIRTYRYGIRVDADWLDTAAVKALTLA